MTFKSKHSNPIVANLNDIFFDECIFPDFDCGFDFAAHQAAQNENDITTFQGFKDEFNRSHGSDIEFLMDYIYSLVDWQEMFNYVMETYKNV